ncbi:MAG: hypothetical protein IT499_13385 [Rubrivivax sp.]|nr:hypothetical protein [Rubrivivax sp.]
MSEEDRAAATRVAIVGPGLMGLGIAQVAARSGCQVRLAGRDESAAMAAYGRLQLALARQVERGRTSAADAERWLSCIAPARHVAELGDCDIAVEAVPEDRALKTTVLRRLERVLAPDAVIATNTSGLPVDGLADALHEPARLVGLHFFSPVERMPLVEVVRGARTAPAVLARGLAWVRALGQHPVVVCDGPGFFTSRVFAAYLDEAIAMVGEGVEPARIEAAGRALGRVLGPLAVVDEVSLALNLQQARQAEADGLPPRARRLYARPVLEAMIACHRAGRRHGGGFFDDGPGGARVPWAGLASLFPPAWPQPDEETVARRLRWAEALEALRCLAEGVVASPVDADAASSLGLAFPGGGVMRWVQATGLAAVRRIADELAARHGERFRFPDGLTAFSIGDPL